MCIFCKINTKKKKTFLNFLKNKHLNSKKKKNKKKILAIDYSGNFEVKII